MTLFMSNQSKSDLPTPLFLRTQTQTPSGEVLVADDLPMPLPLRMQTQAPSRGVIVAWPDVSKPTAPAKRAA
jgi:hypothetical protein